ncbi:MAG TPA: CARDB domain-containing protein [Aggregicoccus sp.]|nr:CARDB domain-containing protein [Aggregicoccus sp.]
MPHTRRARALLALGALSWGAAHAQPPPPPPQPSAVAAGLGVDVEPIAPQSFKDPGGRKRTVFPVKFLCGATEPGGALGWGEYRTLVNLLNLSGFIIKFQATFVTDDGFVEGPVTNIPSRRSATIDCDAIRSALMAASLPTGPFVEGFVVVDDPSHRPLRVTAAYSALHKQVHGLPDLVPMETVPGYCRRDDRGRLLVTLRNQGEASAPASSTRVAFDGQPPVDLATPPLAIGAQADLAPVPFPFRGEGTFRFRITADFPAAVGENNETNNSVLGTCVIIN